MPAGRVLTPPPPLDSLIAIVREAGAAVQGERKKGLAISGKASGGIVTSADRASHDILARRCAERFPGVPLLGEEGEAGSPGPGPMLVADELDGTAPFAAGSGHWGVMLALVDREPTHGVIFLPDLEIMISAEKGRGCRLNGRPVALEADARLAGLLLGTEINDAMTPADWELVRRAVACCRAARCLASAAASACELLTGATHAYLNIRGGKIWDFAAISVAVTEAGGTATDPSGRALAWDALQMSLMAASCPGVMDQLVDGMRLNHPMQPTGRNPAAG